MAKATRELKQYPIKYLFNTKKVVVVKLKPKKREKKRYDMQNSKMK